jgi:hypothetical protein
VVVATSSAEFISDTLGKYVENDAIVIVQSPQLPEVQKEVFTQTAPLKRSIDRVETVKGGADQSIPASYGPPPLYNLLPAIETRGFEDGFGAPG